MNSSAGSDAGTRAALLRAARDELVEYGHGAISLRAIARRAGVSHAAPKHHFADRAGLLTAVAIDGFDALTARLARLEGPLDPSSRLSALGRSYIDFGLANPALFDLMFRPSELHSDDPQLIHAQRAAFSAVCSAIDEPRRDVDEAEDDVRSVSLISWALVHGLVVLARDGALQAAANSATPDAAAALAGRLADQFASKIAAPS